MRVTGLTFMTPGEHTIELGGPKSLKQATARSTPIETLSEAPALRLYWGELHSHGYFSFDARSWGGCTMRPDDMYWYGKNVNGLDFAAVTDHSMHSGRKCGHKNMTEAEFIECQKAAAKNNVDGEFVTFTACEQRCARGDTNVFFLRDDAVYYMKDRAKTIAELWEIYRDEPIFTIPHLHPMVRKPERFDRIDPNKERLVEIHSNHGRYEYHMNEPFRPRKGMVPGNNVQSILARGHRLGVVAASDDHSGRPGITDVTGVYAPKLTRRAIFEAIRARHTYGSTRFRMNIQFRLGDRIMGDEIRVKAGDPLFRSRPFDVRVVAADKLKVVQIVRNGKAVYATEPKGRVAAFHFEDTEPLDQTYLGTEKNNPPTTYYYVRVLQEPDGDESAKKWRRGMAWTSPIFLSPAE